MHPPRDIDIISDLNTRGIKLIEEIEHLKSEVDRLRKACKLVLEYYEDFDLVANSNEIRFIESCRKALGKDKI